jgi:GT2 family glycosyltransferase/Flp pilus assembly protein TadD/2-polyprenyl-3-methyl-5-hydroxy-6-metoxy-1,4-benzoquinol methylase
MSRRTLISFFYTDEIERQTMAPVAQEAERRQYRIRFTDRMDEPAEIGVYCSHRPDPSNAKMSAILLHDLAQRHDMWPDFWRYEPWNRFDIGILPGPAWRKRWQASAGQPEAHPRMGVYELGWPKADVIFRDPDAFQRKVATLRANLQLRPRRSVLYAPSWENDGKQDDLVRSLKDLPVNLLLKQAPWPETYPQILENIRQMNELHRGCAESVYILDPQLGIMPCLGLADLLVTEESSVMVEALLLGIPVVAVTDWLIPDRNPPRPAMIPFDFPVKTTRGELRRTVADLLADFDHAQIDMARIRDEQFSCLGESASRIMDVIDAGWEGRASAMVPVAAEVALPTGPSEYRFDPALRVWRRDDYKGIAYSDGKDTEERILALLRNTGDLTSGSTELERHITDWPTEYHLSSARGNLLRWLTLSPESRVLELGCGCGALTRVLGESGAETTAVEGSVRRAVITAERCRDLSNVRVMADSIETLCLEGLYDVVTLIGVLEYSPLFMPGEDPVGTCLRKARSFLKEGGKLIIAIENQLGLKYFAGSSEDHLGRPFYGIGDLYGPGTAVTFGRNELRRRLAEAGFEGTEFFYPFPDYKLPQVIVSDHTRSVPAFRVADLLTRMSSRDYGREWRPLFPENLAAQALERNGLLLDMANSFLVVATRDRAPRTSWLATHYSSAHRRPSLRVETTFKPDADGRIEVHRRRMMDGQPQPATATWRQEIQAVGPYHDGTLFSTELMRLIAKQAPAQDIAAWLRPWVWLLLEHATWPGQETRAIGLSWMDAYLPGDFADCVPFNLVRDERGRLHSFDREWVHAEEVPLCWVLFRGLYHLQYQAFLPPTVKWEGLIPAILQQLGLPLDKRHDQLVAEYEASLQDYVGGLSAPKEVVCSIIIPVWNKLDLTAQCLKALAGVTTEPSYEVIVVDNASTDGSAEFLASLSGDVRVIQNQENLGFAKACNQGARVARGKYLVFLNNDTIPLKGWLKALVSEVEAYPEVGIVGSKLLYEDGTIQHAGVVLNRAEGLPYHIYKGFSGDSPVVNQRREYQVVTAACLLIRRSLFMELGGFDEGFRNGFEDVDLCLKAGERGSHVVYQPRSVLYHLESQTPGRKLHDDTNAKRLLERWGSHWWLVDEDLRYHTDGYKHVNTETEDRCVGNVRLLEGIQDRAAWAHVAATQAEALKQNWSAVRREIQMVDDWPNDRSVLFWGAKVALWLREPVVHLKFLTRALALKDDPEIRLRVIRGFLEQGDLGAANEQLQQLLTHDPSDAEGLLLKGILCMQREQYESAEAAFDSALREGADRKKCLMGMGMASLGRSYAQGAWEQFLQVLVEHPDDHEAIHWLLRAGTAQNRWQELGEYLRSYATRNPGDLAARFAFASVLFRAEHIEEARGEYDALCKVDPNYDGLSQLGQAIAGREAALAMTGTSFVEGAA